LGGGKRTTYEKGRGGKRKRRGATAKVYTDSVFPPAYVRKGDLAKPLKMGEIRKKKEPPRERSYRAETPYGEETTGLPV